MILLVAVILFLMLGGAIFLAIALIAMQTAEAEDQRAGCLGAVELDRQGNESPSIQLIAGRAESGLQ